MEFKEFNEEKFKNDTDTTELTNLEIVDEAIMTLQEAYFSKNDGFRRIEKISLLAIYLLQQENQELKKQLEEYKNKLMIVTKMAIKEIDKNIFVGIDYFQNKCNRLENQQKVFIEYLEKTIKIYDEDIQRLKNDKNHNCYLSLISDEEAGKTAYKEVLSKYKKIIGDDK